MPVQGIIDFMPFIGVLCILYAFIGADKMEEKDLFKDRNIFGYLRFLNVHETFLKREFYVALFVTALSLVSLILSHMANDATHLKIAITALPLIITLMLINSINYVGIINIIALIMTVLSCLFYDFNVHTVSNPLLIVFTLFFTVLSLLSTVTGLSIGFKLYLVKLMKKG